jgi:hypothetical protein
MNPTMKNTRKSPLEISRKEFRKIGYQLIDSISDFIGSIDKKRLQQGNPLKKFKKLSDPHPYLKMAGLHRKYLMMLLNCYLTILC